MQVSIGLLVATTILLSAAPRPALGEQVPTSTNARALFAAVYRADGLTADQAAERARRSSYAVQAKNAELSAAAAEVDQALIAFLPRLSGKLQYVRLSPIEQSSIGNLVAAPDAGAGPIPSGTPLLNVPLSFPVILNQTSLEASLSLPVSDYVWRLPKSYAAASSSREAAELNLEASELRAAYEARLAYYTWARAVLQVEVARQSLEQARQHLRDVNVLVEAGMASRADGLRVESQLAAVELLQARAANFAALAEHQLRTALHDAPELGYGLGEDLWSVLPPAEGSRAHAELLQEALSQRRELKALDRSIEALGARTAGTRAQYLPRIDAFGGASYANPNPRIVPGHEAFDSSWQVGVAASFSINDMLSARATVDGMEAQAARIAADRAALSDGVSIEVQVALQALAEADVAERTSLRGMSSAEESYRVRRVLWKAGRATSVELTDAETDLTRARLEVINARVDQRVARAKLAHATGRDAARS